MTVLFAFCFNAFLFVMEEPLWEEKNKCKILLTQCIHLEYSSFLKPKH